MKFEIKHKVTGAVLFSLECDSLKPPVRVRIGEVRTGEVRAGEVRIGELGQPNGWSAWTYLTKDGEQRVRVGCRDFTIKEGRKYWADKDDRREVLAALDYAEAIGKLREWGKKKLKEAA